MRLGTVPSHPSEVPLSFEKFLNYRNGASHSLAAPRGVMPSAGDQSSRFFAPAGTRRRSITSRVCTFCPPHPSETQQRAPPHLPLRHKKKRTAVPHSQLQSHEHSSGSLSATISRVQKWLTLSYILTSTAVAHWARLTITAVTHWTTISRAQQWLTQSYNLTSTAVVHRVTVSLAQQWLTELQSHEHSSDSLWVTISRA